MIYNRKSRSWRGLLESEKKIGGNHAFFSDNKASLFLEKKNAIHCFFNLGLFKIIIIIVG